MNELTMEKAYLKEPYKGAEIGFIFEKESDAKGAKGEELEKGYMIILDPNKKLQELLQAASPGSDERRWLKMGALVVVQKSKLQDAYHIVHNFARVMRPIEEEIVNKKDGTISVVTHELYL